MTDILVPLGKHLFSADALNKIAADALTKIPPDKTSAIVGGVDANGANVALVLTKHGAHADVKFVTALEHDWAGGTALGASGVITFCLALLLALPVSAQPIHGHPQKTAYLSQAEWPPHSTQAHWLIVDGRFVPVTPPDEAQALLDPNIAHLHNDLTCPMYGEAEEGTFVSCFFAITLHHFPGRVTSVAVDWSGLFGYARSIHWDATGSDTRPEMVGDPIGDRTWTGTLSLEVRLGITGWEQVELSANVQFENGDQSGARNLIALWVIAPNGIPGQLFPTVESRVTFSEAAHPERIWGDTVAGYVTYLPLAPISVRWPIVFNDYQYGPNEVSPNIAAHGTLEQRVDLDLHHGIPGTTLAGPLPDPIGLVLAFDPAVVAPGLHKFANIWSSPLGEQLAASLSVVFVTIDPTAPPVTPPDLAGLLSRVPPSPVVTPPPPPVLPTFVLPLTVTICDASTPPKCVVAKP